ncbi:MAG: tetratricopeptide repeat protein [Pseudomonadota bacterium]
MAESLVASLDAARRFMANGQVMEADLLVDDVLAQAPGHVEALLLRGAALLARGDRAAAFALYSELANHAPDHPDICANLGVIHRLEGRGEEARFCFERAVLLAPRKGSYHCALANLLLTLGALDDARDAIRAAAPVVEESGDDALEADLYGIDARLALLERRFPAAERAVRRALEVRPNHEPDLSLLCGLVARSGRSEEAVDLAERIYRAAPTALEHGVQLAGHLLDVGRTAEAERHLRRCLAVAPAHVEATFLMGRLQLLRGEGAAAISAFAALVKTDPRNADLLARIGGLLRLNGDLERALLVITQAAQLEGAPPALAGWCEEIKLALGRVGEVWPSAVNAADLPPAVQIPLGTPAGEVVFFARFAARYADQDRPLVCHAEPALLPLLEGVVGLSGTSGAAGPDLPLLSELPERIGVRPDDRRGAPYLAVSAGRFAAWTQALAGRSRPWIGLMWDPGAGPDLATVREIARASGGEDATLISLAFDQRREQLAGIDSVLDVGGQFRDARDLMAVMAHLDLTLACDGLAAHVAGAMGRPVVVGVPALQPWMWAHEGGHALWYASARVVRASPAGRWDVPAAVAAARIALGRAEQEGP